MAKLFFFFSVMNAGKTLALLSARMNYLENSGNVVLITSSIDDRSGVGKISSRIGVSADAIAVSSNDNIFKIVDDLNRKQPVTAVLIDEVQFCTSDHVWQCSNIVDELGIPVMAYGLKNNVLGSLFGPAVETLLALADSATEIKQLCHCGRKATMILRYSPDGKTEKHGNVVEVGGDNRYISVCRKHWKSDDIGPARRAALEADLFDR